ncbi:MAG TPA: hypothetical protein VMW47_04550 [Verrucomicrobiae bacterium]|nr:hypothetical protein [Verrucomicrobiae bacterium]
MATSSVSSVVEVGALIVAVYTVARLRPRPGRGWRLRRPTPPDRAQGSTPRDGPADPADPADGGGDSGPGPPL